MGGTETSVVLRVRAEHLDGPEEWWRLDRCQIERDGQWIDIIGESRLVPLQFRTLDQLTAYVKKMTSMYLAANAKGEGPDGADQWSIFLPEKDIEKPPGSPS